VKVARHVTLRLALMGLGVLLAPCDDPFDLCAPTEGRLGFYSRGDCVVTRAAFFGGHRWITELANDALPEETRLSEEELTLVVDGNRRMDWPKELLVHMNTGLHAYAQAVLAYTNDPEKQHEHALLAERDTPAEALETARASVRRRTSEAVLRWDATPRRALTLVGEACHTIQDSFSTAHTRRRADTGCIETVKGYIARAPGFEDIEYHGQTSDDELGGHSTPEDSIFRDEEGCREPDGEEAIRACMRPSALDAARATTEYLAVVRAARARGGWDAEADAELDAFFAARLALCE
jgi:hypothetical protein